MVVGIGEFIALKMKLDTNRSPIVFIRLFTLYQNKN